MHKPPCRAKTLLPYRRLPAVNRIVSNNISAAIPAAIPLSLTVALAAQLPAQALSFRLDFDNNVPDEFQLATQEATSMWSSVLKDDVVVDLRIEYSDLSKAGSILGGVQPGKVKVKYEDYVDALLKDSVSSTDFKALDSLPLSSKGSEVLQAYQSGSLSASKAKLESKEFSFLMDAQFARGNREQSDFVDNNGNNNNKNIQLTRAQAKALGLKDPRDRGLDALIKLNSNVAWDANRSDGIDTDKYDASTVLQHEIGHALGIVSGVDALDFLASTSEPVDEIEKNKFSYLTPLDFYRYSSESAELGVMDVTLGGGEKYFSLDGGQSAVTDSQGRRAAFSTGSLSVDGDGYQGSHWKANGVPLGVMHPVLKKGQAIDISELDLTLLDSVGWNLTDTSIARAAEVGIDWEDLQQELARDRDATTSSIYAEWNNDIPAIEAALGEAAIELEGKFRTKLQEEFDKLSEKLEDENDAEKRQEEIDKFYEKIDKEATKRNEELRKLPEEIYKKDQEIREWLTLSTDDLAKELQKAEGEEINRLSNIIKAMPSDERTPLEEKLEDALGQFVEKPDKLVEDLLKTSGPANPVRWGYAYRWWWYRQEAEENSYDEAIEDIDDFLYAATAAEGSTRLDKQSFYHNNFTGNGLSFENLESQDAKDVPEPSSVLALFGIAALGMSYARKR